MGRFDPDKEEYYAAPKTEPAASPAPERRFAPETHFPGAPSTTAPPGASKTWGETFSRAGQTAIDTASAAANTATFGMDIRRDALAGWLAGDYPSYSAGVDAERAKLEKQRARSPIATTVGDVAGAVALPGMGGAGLAARGVQAGLRPFIARGLGYGAEGAAVGAGQAAGTTYTGNVGDYAKNALTGGLIGGAAGGTLGSVFGPRQLGPRSTAEVPSTDRLYREKTANYDELARQPQIYEPQAVSARAGDVETQLRGAPNLFEPGTAPIAFRGVGHMHEPPTTAHLGRGVPVSPGDLEAIVQGINKNVVQGSPDSVAGGMVKRAINDFILNPPQGAVMPGMEAAAREASAIANRARGNYGGYRRGEFIDDLIDNARTSAGSTVSGLNLQNVLRQGARSAVRRTKGESPASRAGFNDAEIGQLTEYARVKPVDEALRYVDRLMGGGGGLGAGVATGLGVGAGAGTGWLQGDPTAGAIIGAGVLPAGLMLRRYGNRRAERQIEELADTFRRRTPLYAERAAVAPVVTLGKSGSQMLRDAITTGLIAKGFGQEREEGY